jgi:hypothetical protein
MELGHMQKYDNLQLHLLHHHLNYKNKLYLFHLLHPLLLNNLHQLHFVASATFLVSLH